LGSSEIGASPIHNLHFNLKQRGTGGTLIKRQAAKFAKARKKIPTGNTLMMPMLESMIRLKIPLLDILCGLL
jgi:hypothetical protein